jgi:Tfp pilus assembly protein PilO
MKKYFAQLRPLERRLAVAVLVIVFLALNWWFIWPHFSDWGDLQQRGAAAAQKLKVYQQAISQGTGYQKLVKEFESSGEVVAREDQGVDFVRAVQTQSYASGVGILKQSPQITSTNDQFFVEQVLNVNVQGTDDQLVDFLYKLGTGASMIRVRGLELQPDPPHQHLTAQIRLVASYQKNPAAKTVAAVAAGAKSAPPGPKPAPPVPKPVAGGPKPAAPSPKSVNAIAK